MNLLDRIRRELEQLSGAEQAVAQLVLKDPSGFQKLPVTTLAKRAGVSSPSVVRFCRTLGYEGLSDFKLKLAASLNSGVPFIHQAVQQGDTGETLIQKVLDNAIHTLSNFRNTAPAQPISQAAKLITKAISTKGRLVFYGVGNSGFIALDAEHKFFRMGCAAQAYSDGHLQIMAASMLNKGDSLIIISNSGRSQDLLDATRIARQAGAGTIAITASGSPLAEEVQVHIPADHGEYYEQYSPMVSRLLHLCIVDVLATQVALQLGDSVQKNMARLKKNLIESRYAK
ncbi:MurR/RpiR family transcriptional regulator [Limnobacter parvus]|uniref:SIS domain-containing protein n=1 Tax=Limnobacter parvus TaxID=2939690 RepID=A0ABT1XE29_9BURK|nr:SIS domain-containing protein [Limnobacter parvus]MCR2745523.1 SIS domain-containing protein [Limnobacter parvus]